MALDQTALTALYTDTTTPDLLASGTITFSTAVPTAAARASGTISLSGQPTADTDSFTINGTQLVFKASGATGNQVNIGLDQAATLAALLVVLNASVDAQLVKFTYASNLTTTITATAKVWGTAGNSLTLAKSGTNLAVSGGNLTGGTAGDSVTVNGVALQFIPASQTSPTATDVAIGATFAATSALLKTYLNASVNSSIDDAVYTDSGTGIVTVTHKVGGTGGNSFTLAKSGTNIAVSGATLSGGTSNSAIGQFQVVGTDIGEVLVARADNTFEDNMLALMAAIDFVVQNTADPSTSVDTAVTCRRQRKVLKETLQELAAAIRPNLSTTDTRAADAAIVRAKGIAKYNADNRPAL